jgi:5-methylcytosine-specific restriction endonuclease McrA
VDHRYAPNRHEIDDLWLLCEEHHQQKTVREGIAGRRKKKKGSRREPERHPGLRSA